MVGLWISATGAVVEALGGAGFDRFNAGQRIEWLTSVHGVGAALGALAILTMLAAVAAVGSVFAAGSGDDERYERGSAYAVMMMERRSPRELSLLTGLEGAD